jgi:membrane protein implicated in regulation of membrane protease activity
MPEWWGLTFTQTLLVISAIMLIIDLFLLSDVPTQIAYVLLSWLVAVQFEVPVLVSVLIGLITWIALVVFHYMIWRGVLEGISAKIAPARYQSGPDRLIGRWGVIREIDGRRLVAVEGELWVFESPQPVDVGVGVMVLAQRDGFLIVEQPTTTTGH